MKKSILTFFTLAAVFGGALLTSSVARTAPEIDDTIDKEWRRYVEAMLPLGSQLADTMLADKQDPQLRQELYRAIFMALSAGYLPVFHANPEQPELVPFTGQLLNLLGPNPDAVYYMSAVDEKGTYKISGYRGSVREVIFQVGGGLFVTRGDGQKIGTTLANYSIDDLSIQEDGFFSVILSAQRPEGYTGDWWHLPAGATNLPIRQVAYDWLTEVDARIGIERLDSPAQKPRMTANDISSNLDQLIRWAQAYVSMSNMVMTSYQNRDLINKLAFIAFGEHGGIQTQQYPEGIFELENDEAIILETDIPESCFYWSFQLTDTRWSSYDWMHRQTSLNGFTAKIDSDGKFRAVISSEDPGIHNWLDTLGYQRGVIQGRWNKCSSWPLPTLTKVKFKDRFRHLPKETIVVTAEDREAMLRQRNLGAQLRRKW